MENRKERRGRKPQYLGEWDAAKDATLQEVFNVWDRNRRKRMIKAIARGEFRDVYAELRRAIVGVLARHPEATATEIAGALNVPLHTVTAVFCAMGYRQVVVDRGKRAYSFDSIPEPTPEEAARIEELFNGALIPIPAEVASLLDVPVSHVRAWIHFACERRGFKNRDDYNQAIREQEMERNSVIRPAEYVEEIMRRGAVGVKLPEPEWSRYYRLYQLKNQNGGASLIRRERLEKSAATFLHDDKRAER